MITLFLTQLRFLIVENNHLKEPFRLLFLCQNQNSFYTKYEQTKRR